MSKIANRDARGMVQRRINFNANNIWGTHHENIYAVYSYRQSFPIWLYDKAMDVWCRNEDKYSQTTSKHTTQTCPTDKYLNLSTEDMLGVIRVRSLEKYRRDIAIRKLSGEL